MLKNVYLAGGVRTPFGSFNGALSNVQAPQLGSAVIKASLLRAGIKPGDVDEVYFGNVIGAGLGQNVARQASVGAGLPLDVGATTINKVCGSSLRTTIIAAQAIQCGDAGLIVAGGCESMTNAPYLLRKARIGYRMGHGELIDSMIHDGLWDVYTNKHMGLCGDQCAAKYNISRQDQDSFAIESYLRAKRSWEEGFYEDIVIPVEIAGSKGVTVVDHDEDVAKFTGEEKLRGLKPAFGAGGSVTAGNASKINDGAAAMVVFDDDRKQRLGLKPEVRILGHANVAMEPDWFTIAPIYAIRKLCEQLSIQPGDVDLYEINEAFSVVAVAAIRELKIDPKRVNVAGGAVAIGHPVGATGARIINTAVRAMTLQKKRLGVVCACIGGGEATAIALERY